MNKLSGCKRKKILEKHTKYHKKKDIPNKKLKYVPVYAMHNNIHEINNT